jgi:hypothetical protein
MKKIATLFITVAISIFFVSPIFAWGHGHDTIARETLKLFPGKWGERLRDGKGGKIFISSSHAPDDMKTRLIDRAAYLDKILIERLTPTNGKMPVMYRFHSADARCELILAMSRAMRSGNEEALGFLLACFNHSVADTVSANHSPLIHLVTYNWRTLGLIGAVDDDCVMLEKTPERKALFSSVAEKECAKITSARFDAQLVFDAVYLDEVIGPEFFRYDCDISSGGKAAIKAFAHEASDAIHRTVQAFLAAESFSTLPDEPVFNKALTQRRFNEKAKEFLLKRSMEDDAITLGVLPKSNHVPKIGVLYDPTGFWTRGIVFMANRVLAVQIAATLKKENDVSLLDIREVIAKGVPSGVKTIVAPCSGLGEHFGFSPQAFISALKRFVENGGDLIWVGGKPKPPKELFPETVAFIKNTARAPWGYMCTPVPADEMKDGILITPQGRFSCVREPRGTAGWYWGQLGLDFLPSNPLPEGCREIVRFEAKDGRKVIAGYVKGRCAFIPAFSVFPYLFTDTRPSVSPLVLELDRAGEAVIKSALQTLSNK